MKDLFLAVVIVFVCIGAMAAVPVFGLVAGTGAAILFLKYIITESKKSDEENNTGTGSGDP